MKDYKYKIFTDSIEENIQKDILKNGDKLPSARRIKKEYGISITTIQKGYDYLVFKGLVRSVPRLGYIVNLKSPISPNQDQSKFQAIPIDSVFRDNIFLTTQQRKHSEISTLNAAVPSDLLIPQNLILRTMQQIIREKGTALLRYYPPNGIDELHRLISRRYALHGADIKPDEIIITDGALQALYIALAVTTEPNDIIAIESPCVFSVLEVISNLKLRIIEIPVRANIGFNVEYLDDVCQKNAVKAILLTPNFHNPTGILMEV